MTIMLDPVSPMKKNKLDFKAYCQIDLVATVVFSTMSQALGIGTLCPLVIIDALSTSLHAI